MRLLVHILFLSFSFCHQVQVFPDKVYIYIIIYNIPDKVCIYIILYNYSSTQSFPRSQSFLLWSPRPNQEPGLPIHLRGVCNFRPSSVPELIHHIWFVVMSKWFQGTQSTYYNKKKQLKTKIIWCTRPLVMGQKCVYVETTTEKYNKSQFLRVPISNESGAHWLSSFWNNFVSSGVHIHYLRLQRFEHLQLTLSNRKIIRWDSPFRQ